MLTPENKKIEYVDDSYYLVNYESMFGIQQMRVYKNDIEVLKKLEKDGYIFPKNNIS